MANPEHLKILKQGVEAWNRWREENPGMRPDLTFANLSRRGLAGVDFTYADLRATNFRDAIYNAWREGSAYSTQQGLVPLPEHIPGQDASALFLARLLLPADQAPAGQRPARRSTESVEVRNDLRPFVVTANALARWLNIQLTAEL